MSVPFHRTVPAVGLVIVASTRISVDLPAPFGPSSPSTPGPRSSPTPSSAVTPSRYRFANPEISSRIAPPRATLSLAAGVRSCTMGVSRTPAARLLSFDPVGRKSSGRSTEGTTATASLTAAPGTIPAPADIPFRRLELLVFAVALLVRLVYLWQLSGTPLAGLVIGDAEAYDAWARRIAAGDWLGRAEGVFYQAPLYSYTLGVLYAVTGPSVAAARVLQAILGAFAAALLARAGRSLFSPRTGLLAGLALALYAPAVYFTGILQKSVLDLFFACLLLALIAPVRAIDTSPRGLARFLAVGAGLAGFMLTRENAVVLVVVVVVWVSAQFRSVSWRTRGAAIAAVFAGLVVVLLPVALRNQVVGGEFHLTTSQLGPNLYLGNNPTATGFYAPLKAGRGSPQFERIDARELAEQARGRTLSPSEVSKYWRDESLRFITGQPVRWLALMVRKAALVFSAVEVGDTDDYYGAADACWVLGVLSWPGQFTVVFGLAAAGAVLTWDERRRLWYLGLAIVLFAGSVALFLIYGRYRLPLVPFLALFAAAGIDRAWPLLRTRRRRALLGPGLAALAAVALALLPLASRQQQAALTPFNMAHDLTYAKKDPTPAVPLFREAIRLQPDYALAYLGLGDALGALGRLDEAIAAWTEAERLAPELEPAFFNHGLALLDARRAGEAAPLLARAAAINPGRARTYTLLGNALFAAGQVEAAANAYEAASRLEPTSAQSVNNLGTALARLGRLDEALARFREASTLDPRYAEAHANAGKALVALGRHDEAAVELEAALRIDPAHAEARRRLDVLLGR